MSDMKYCDSCRSLIVVNWWLRLSVVARTAENASFLT